MWTHNYRSKCDRMDSLTLYWGHQRVRFYKRITEHCVNDNTNIDIKSLVWLSGKKNTNKWLIAAHKHDLENRLRWLWISREPKSGKRQETCWKKRCNNIICNVCNGLTIRSECLLLNASHIFHLPYSYSYSCLFYLLSELFGAPCMWNAWSELYVHEHTP